MTIHVRDVSKNKEAVRENIYYIVSLGQRRNWKKLHWVNFSENYQKQTRKCEIQITFMITVYSNITAIHWELLRPTMTSFCKYYSYVKLISSYLLHNTKLFRLGFLVLCLLTCSETEY